MASSSDVEISNCPDHVENVVSFAKTASSAHMLLGGVFRQNRPHSDCSGRISSRRRNKINNHALVQFEDEGADIASSIADLEEQEGADMKLAVVLFERGRGR